MLINEEIAEGLEFLWLQTKIAKVGVRDERVLENLDLVEGILCESLLMMSEGVEWFEGDGEKAVEGAGEDLGVGGCCGCQGCFEGTGDTSEGFFEGVYGGETDEPNQVGFDEWLSSFKNVSGR